jgi:translation elongation factor EF-1alpha
MQGLNILLPYACDSKEHGPEDWAELQRRAIELGKGSFQFAFAFDHRRDEREAGLSIYPDNFAHVLGTPLTLLDAPGHTAYVRNQASVASFADTALLCVSADSNLYASLGTAHIGNLANCLGGVPQGDDGAQVFCHHR